MGGWCDDGLIDQSIDRNGFLVIHGSSSSAILYVVRSARKAKTPNVEMILKFQVVVV